MPDLAPIEKLQPCLLDRLTDDAPTKKEESRNERVVSLQRYKRGVLRDLEWLFNASAHLPEEGGEGFLLSDFEHAVRSVLNYGTRHLFGLVAPDMMELERQLLEAIQLFEPRILKHTLEIKAEMQNQVVVFEIQGELWASPVSERLFIKTQLDIESGACTLGDSGHG